MRRNSNQHITKIKKDPIEALLKDCEAMDVKDSCTVEPVGSDLATYPDMDNLRLWTRDNLTSGLDKVYVSDITEDGQTYLTTLIDGLPLFTKLTKSISNTDSEIIYTQPKLDQNGVVGGSYAAVESNIDDESIYKLFNDVRYNVMFTSGSYVTFYNPNPLYLSSLNIFLESANDYSFTVYGSNDNNIWTQLGSTSGTPEESNITIDTTHDSVFTFIKLQSNDVASISAIDLTATMVDDKATIETSKPGLWLSNLTSVYKNSVNGGYLRGNLIHDNEEEHQLDNSDIIGNYSNSYLASGIIHRTLGSVHHDSDSYQLHWSPSSEGTTAHESLIINDNNLQQNYTSYQTLAIPNNSNMQSFSMIGSKDVEFNSIDNIDGTNITNYNARFVGNDWSYEYELYLSHPTETSWKLFGQVHTKNGCTYPIDQTIYTPQSIDSSNEGINIATVKSIQSTTTTYGWTIYSNGGATFGNMGYSLDNYASNGYTLYNVSLKSGSTSYTYRDLESFPAEHYINDNLVGTLSGTGRFTFAMHGGVIKNQPYSELYSEPGFGRYYLYRRIDGSATWSVTRTIYNEVYTPVTNQNVYLVPPSKELIDSIIDSNPDVCSDELHNALQFSIMTSSDTHEELRILDNGVNITSEGYISHVTEQYIHGGV